MCECGMSKPYRIPVKSKIAMGLEKISEEGVDEIDVAVFLIDYANALPYPYSINMLKSLAPKYGYAYYRGRLYRKARVEGVEAGKEAQAQ